MRELPDSVLRRWPGRFRFARLSQELTDGATAGGGRLPRAVLYGLIDGHDEKQAAEQLITAGRFRAARRLIDECPLWDRKFRLEMSRQIESQTVSFQQELAASYQASGRRAEVAGVPWPPVLADLMELCVEDWSAVRTDLDDAEDLLTASIAARRDALQERIDAESPAAPVRDVCAGLLLAEQLEAVAHLLEHGSLDIVPPEAIEPVPPLYPERPVEILRWHLNPAAYAPVEFTPHRNLPDRDGHELLVKFQALEHEPGERVSEETARQFATALSVFLIGSADDVSVDPVAYGYLATLPGVLDVPQASWLLTASSLQLFVCDPDVTTPPPTPGLGPHVLVGWGLTTAQVAGRSDGAVLALEDLLRLVEVRADRAVALLRIIGPQWTPAFLGVGTPAQLGRMLRRGSPWETLVWLTELAGLGGSVTAARLAYLSGEYDPRVLFAVLDFLMQPGPHPHVRERVVQLAQWWKDGSLSRIIEEAVTGPIRGNPNALMAFWAALESAIPGHPVTVDDAAVTCALEGGGSDLGQPLSEGLTELARHKSIAAAVGSGLDGPDIELRLQPSGAIIGLRDVAAARLRGRLAKVGEARQAETAGAAPVTVWRAYRFALRREWPSALAALADPSADHEAVYRDLAQSVTELLAQPVEPTGPTDVREAVDELLAALRAHRPELTATLDCPAALTVAVNRCELLVVLHELLANAAEAITGPGRVRVTVQDADPDVIIDVHDSGPGIPDEIEQEYRVFRSGVTTKGAARGQGLYLALQLVRRLGYELTVEARRDEHPVLRGARFRVVLPRG